VDDARLGGKGAEGSGQAVVEARADGEHHVALLQGVVAVRLAVHAAPTERQGVGGREGAHAQQAGGDGDVGLLGQLAQFRLGFGHRDTLPGDDDRPLRLVQQASDAGDYFWVGAKLTGPVAGQVDRRGIGELHGRLLDALGDVYQHRARAAGAGDVERLFERVGQVADVGDEVVVLGHRHADGADVGLLEAVAAEEGLGNLAGDGHDRRRVHEGRGQSGHQIGRARAGRGEADADPARRPRIAIGHVRRALLVRHQHVVHRIAVLVEIVISGEDGSTRQAENDFDPLMDQALPDYLSTRLQLTHVFSS